MQRNKHELLAPAGDRECLRAAVCGGADAVYFGASSFNARARATNFGNAEIKEAIDYCHAYGKKAYVTLNTALREKELGEALELAASLYSAGADALICADIGLISQIKKQIPELEVHVSTQAGVRSSAGADLFSSLGASRVVLSRELNRAEIRDITKNAMAETEVFIHGALCVSVSGRCLFSSLVGGRSGNRGECAQPCRLPYEKDRYLLSLKDLCLAKHLTELCDMGVASFKIEGRMKSPEYVYSVTRIYRRLLDSARNATDVEVKELSEIFSRGGFTDGYYTGRITPAMNGIRGELTEPKRQLSEKIEEPRIPLSLYASIKRGEELTLTYSSEDKGSVTVRGCVPQEAQSRPMESDDYLRPLSALGNTQFFVKSADIDCDPGLMVPVSALKNARRKAIDALASKYVITREKPSVSYTEASRRSKRRIKSAKFFLPGSVSDRAREFFDVIFIPSDRYESKTANGAFLPEITSEGECEELKRTLASLKERGCRHILVSDIGQLPLVLACGFESVHTDIGFNIYNTEAASLFEDTFKVRTIASPELNLSAQRALGSAPVVYGRIPLMTLKKCIGRELIGCDKCKKGDGIFRFRDRKGVTFTGMRACSHGSVIFNSVPTYVGDDKAASSLTDVHFIFTTESRSEADGVISAYAEGRSLGVPVRRIK
ncbi:MAG: U32 family peptidase [Clostridia bacterium]|nr:U32 family peptidase [Clostridia bacterium]